MIKCIYSIKQFMIAVAEGKHFYSFETKLFLCKAVRFYFNIIIIIIMPCYDLHLHRIIVLQLSSDCSSTSILPVSYPRGSVEPILKTMTLEKLRFAIITCNGLLQSCLVRPTAVQTRSSYCSVRFRAYILFLT